jgi:putative urate catabolism protein
MTAATPDRDLQGYGPTAPDPRWPGNARIAVQFVLNYEEGAELSPVNGDATWEPFMNEVALGEPDDDRRNPTSESLYGYGARVGVWRLLRLFAEHGVPMTAFVVGRALELNTEVGAALADHGHEIAGHGYRWIDYRGVPEHVEREHIARTVEAIVRCTGSPPVGWFTGRVSANTRRLVIEHGGFLYDADAFDDDLPYWTTVEGQDHLVVPYTFDANDMKFTTSPGFVSGGDFLSYLCDGFDMLYAEGADQPKMMSIGLHARVMGRPSRAMAVARFLDYVCSKDDVWLCRRSDIARHWIAHHAPPGASRNGASWPFSSTAPPTS